jgi:hypothetical protein
MPATLAPAPTLIYTKPLIDSLGRLPLWPDTRALHRLLMSLAPWELVPEVHAQLPYHYCYVSDGRSQLGWCDPTLQGDVKHHQPYRGPENRLLLPRGYFVVLGECILRAAPDLKYFPRDEYPADEAVLWTLRFARQQALEVYGVHKGEEYRMRFEDLDRACKAKGLHL